MARKTKTRTSARATVRKASTKKSDTRLPRSASTGTRRSAEVHQRPEPKSPMPRQHQEKPGLESKVTPRPRYEAPNYKGSDKLAGKVALITGGDSGIGRAVAVLFAREGADVAFTYLKEEESDARKTKEAIEREGRRGLMMTMEARDSDSCRKAVETTINNFGKLSILVNNAAYQESQDSIEELTEEQWDRTFKTNIYRSEERRVGKECRSRWSPSDERKE